MELTRLFSTSRVLNVANPNNGEGTDDNNSVLKGYGGSIQSFYSYFVDKEAATKFAYGADLSSAGKDKFPSPLGFIFFAFLRFFFTFLPAFSFFPSTVGLTFS